jgi:hypothetical protein
MTQLTTSPFMVSLVQAAMALPVFLSNSSSWCFGGYGGPSKIFARDTSVDGGGVRDLGHPHFDELYESRGFWCFLRFCLD